VIKCSLLDFSEQERCLEWQNFARFVKRALLLEIP
jgi:hypothetical protein